MTGERLRAGWRGQEEGGARLDFVYGLLLHLSSLVSLAPAIERSASMRRGLLDAARRLVPARLLAAEPFRFSASFSLEMGLGVFVLVATKSGERAKVGKVDRDGFKGGGGGFELQSERG
jgi:hypothetical protein